MTGLSAASPPPQSKTKWVIDTLLEDIRSGRLSSGDPLRVDEIARRLGVSSTPVREALRHLAAQRAVDITPHRGATVSSMSNRDLKILYRMRAELESLAAEIAAAEADTDAIERITKAHKQLAAAVNQKRSARRLSELNRNFHFEVFGAVSELVASTIRNLWDLIPATMTQDLWHDKDNAATFIEAHGQIVKAIVDRDPKRAGTLMADHAQDALSRRRKDGAG